MGSDSVSEDSPDRRFRTLFISDVHLGARGSQADKLLDFLRTHDADTVYLVGDTTLIGLHQHGTPPPEGVFSEFRVGLDHVAFGCADRGELEKWALRLDELGIDRGEIKDAAYGSGLSFRDPDGVALEFFAPPG